MDDTIDDTTDIAYRIIDDVELGAAVIGLLLLALYATGVVENELVLITALGILSSAVGYEQFDRRVR